LIALAKIVKVSFHCFVVSAAAGIGVWFFGGIGAVFNKDDSIIDPDWDKFCLGVGVVLWIGLQIAYWVKYGLK